MQALSHFLYRVSKGRFVLLALAALLLFTFFALPGQNELIQKYSQGSGSPDTSLCYNATEIYHMAELYGAEGRAAYLRARWTFDLVFPVVFTLFLASAISWLLGRALPADSRWRLLNLAPVAAMLADYGENLFASLVMWRYPLHCPVGELMAPVATLLKWTLVTISILIMLGSGFLLIHKKLKHP